MIADLAADLVDLPNERVRLGSRWLLRPRPVYAPVIWIAEDVGDQALRLGDVVALAYQQPITGDGFKEIFGLGSLCLLPDP